MGVRRRPWDDGVGECACECECAGLAVCVHARRAAGWKYRGNGVRIAGLGGGSSAIWGWKQYSTAQHNIAMQRRDDDVRVKFSSFFKGCCYLRGPSIGTAFGSVYYTRTPGYHALSETPVLLKETPRFHANYDNRLTVNVCSCRRIEERREQVKGLETKYVQEVKWRKMHAV
jgi:hypothetical protein